MARLSAALRAFLVAALWIFLASSQLIAQDYAGQAQRSADDFRASLQRIQSELQVPAITDQKLAEQRRLLEDIRANALQQATNLSSPISNINAQISRLGPPPAAGVQESQAITAQREQLKASLDKLQSARTQLEVIGLEAEQLSGRASSIQRDQFFSRIFEGSKSILNPVLWYDTTIGLGQLWQRIGGLLRNWWNEVSPNIAYGGLLILPLSIIALAGLYWVFRDRVRRFFDISLLASRTPSEIDRFWRIARAILATVILLSLATLVISVTLDTSNLLTPRISILLETIGKVISATLLYAVFARRLAAVRLPAWRILALDDTSARRFAILVTLAGFVSTATEQLQVLTDQLYLPISSTIGQSAISASVMVVLLALILITITRQIHDQPAKLERVTYFSWAKPFLPLVWVLLALSAIALVLGYIAFANFVAHQVFDTAVLIVILFVLHHLSDAAVAASIDPSTLIGRVMRRYVGLSEKAIGRLGIFFRTAVDIILVVVGVPLLVLQWTLTWIDFRSLFNTAFFGFNVGNITISPWSVLLIILIIAAGVILTNLIVRWLDHRVLEQSQISKGVQDSIMKGSSYAGYIIAALFAFTAAGIDFSSLALIAGALGIGIGLGLQSIVNNFVSGIILLVERPIRQGDWIVIDAGEGIVRRINVRSTQIETFDSQTIIVPNSMLITSAVRNWTYADNVGRFTIPVTVEYGSDPAQICKILKDIADANRAVMSDPPSSALFVGFLDIGMKFELKAHVSDVFESGFVASDIRIAIEKAFREAGILMPNTAPPRPAPPPPAPSK
jgi:small-conductance mechanosensitive channel